MISKTHHKHFSHLLTQHQSILILVRRNPSIDALATAWGMAHFLTYHNFSATVACDDPYATAASLSFLPTPTDARTSIANTRDMILSFNTTRNNITDVRTQRGEDSLTIYLTPEHGMIDARDFSFTLAQFPFDLVITIGASDKEEFGALYNEMPDIFYEVPVLALHDSTIEESFAHVDIADMMASSLGEIAYTLCRGYSQDSMTPEIAQCFLTAITSATHSFQNPDTTPQALEYASELINYGANQSDVVMHLYKTQSLDLIKLWGKALESITWDPSNAIAMALLQPEDFEAPIVAPQMYKKILQKIKENYSSGKIFALLYKDAHDRNYAIIDAERYGAIATADFTKTSDNTYTLTLPAGTLLHARQTLLEQLNTLLAHTR